jgi:hypothetical protein
VDDFDHFSKVLLDLYKELKPSIKEIAESDKQVFGKLLAKAMLDTNELQVHFLKLSEEFIDISLIALLGIY